MQKVIYNQPMKNFWILDIETNGLIREVHTIHCIVFTNAHTGKTVSFDTARDNIEAGVDLFKKILKSKNNYIVGHNVVGYDAMVFNKLYGIDLLPYADKFIDTMLWAQMATPAHYLASQGKWRYKFPLTAQGKVNQTAIESNSLKSWGYRLDLYKGDNDFEEGWEVFTPAMLKYCKLDTKVTVRVFKYLLKYQLEFLPRKSQNTVENYIALTYVMSELIGWNFDVATAKAKKLTLEIAIGKIDVELTNSFIPLIVADGEPQNPTKTRNSSVWVEIRNRSCPLHIVSPVAYTKAGKPKTKKLTTFKEEVTEDGETLYYYKVPILHSGSFQKVKVKTFKAGSRQSILDFMLKKYGWKPTDLTKSFNPKLDSDTFAQLPYPEAKPLAERFKLNKSLSEVNTLLTGVESDEDERVRTSMRSIGTNTMRTTSNALNLSQINAKGGFRQLFLANDGWEMIGSDLSGAEIVLLGHFLEPYDNGAMTEIKANADVHQNTADLCGIERQPAKIVLFSTLYGSSGTKLGHSLWYDGCMNIDEVTEEQYNAILTKLKKRCKTVSDVEFYPISKDHYIKLTSLLVYQTIYGTKIQHSLKSGIVGYEVLEKSLATRHKEVGYTVLIGGKKLRTKSGHSALNYTLQGSNAVYVKYWTYYINRLAQEKLGLKFGKDYLPLVSVYDEYQMTCKKEHTKSLIKVYKKASELANKALDSVKMEIDTQVGPNWGKTH